MFVEIDVALFGAEIKLGVLGEHFVLTRAQVCGFRAFFAMTLHAVQLSVVFV